MYKDFIHFFVLSCQKATYLLEKRNHTRLTVLEKWQLKLHLSICGYCAGYDKEARLIDEAIRKVAEEGKEKGNRKFSHLEVEEFKQRTVKKVKHRSKEIGK
ncbi:MAG: hypothetical protein ACRC3Z_04765 [Phocaeicola sp.]